MKRHGAGILQGVVGGLIGAILSIAASSFAGQISFFNPVQLQIPATGADFNSLIGQINSNTVPNNGPNALSSGPGSASGALTTNQTTNPNTIVDGVQVVGTGAGALRNPGGYAAGPIIQAVGSDTNINLALGSQGNGVVQFASGAMWTAQPGFAVCPGATGAIINNGPAGPGAGQLIVPSPTITGFLTVLDWKGKLRAIPTC